MTDSFYKRILRAAGAFLVPAVVSLSAIPLSAAETDTLPRPVTSVYRLEAGASSAQSTYLSPVKYTGSGFTLSGEWSKAFNKCPDHIVMRFAGSGTFRDMLNPASTARMLGIEAMFNWGMAWRQRLPHDLQISAGADIEISGGALYLPRNGNNPVTAMAFAGLDLNFSIGWHSRIGRLPFVVSDRIAIPSLGTFFSPQYGESYYEIYLGNHKGLAHCGWWGNHFGIDNLLSVKLDFGRTAMEIGYRYRLHTEYANGLNTHVITNAFVIGIIPHGLGLKKRKNANYSVY